MAELVPPPPYSASALNFEWTIDKKLAFTQELLKALDDEEKEDEFVREVESLGQKTQDLRSGFQTAAKKFQQLYDGETDEEFKKSVQNFQSEWEGYLNEFEKIQNDAKALAARAAAIARDFSDVFRHFVEDPTVPLEKKKEQIEQYVEFVKKDEESSQDIKTRFTNLKNNVVNFRQRWHNAAEKQKGNIDDKISQLTSEIYRLTTEIASATAEVITYGFVTGLLGVSALAFFGLALVCPLALIGGVLFGVLTAVAAVPLLEAIQKLIGARIYIIEVDAPKSVTDKNSLKKQKETQLEDLKNRKELINKIEAEVGSADEKTDPIFKALGAFEDVWQNILTDLREIGTTLELIEQVGEDEAEMARRRISICMKTYHKLHKAFDAYARLP